LITGFFSASEQNLETVITIQFSATIPQVPQNGSHFHIFFQLSNYEGIQVNLVSFAFLNAHTTRTAVSFYQRLS